MNDLLNRLKARNADVESRDDDLRDELEEKRGTEGVAPDFELRDLGDDVNPGDLAQETIVMRTGRPVLAILRNQAELTFTDPDSMVWKSRLEKRRVTSGQRRSRGGPNRGRRSQPCMAGHGLARCS